MSNSDEKIYLDQKGYEEYLDEIKFIRNQLVENGKEKAEAHRSAPGDGWHDNFDFEDAKRKELLIMGLLEAKIKGLSSIVIMDKGLESNVIDIDDYVTVLLQYENDIPEEIIFQLVGSANPELNSEISKISLNSPLGKAVYNKKVGDSISYDVLGSITQGIIINKQKSFDNLEKDKSLL